MKLIRYLILNFTVFLLAISALTACQLGSKDWNVEVNLAPEEISEIEGQIKETKNLIQEQKEKRESGLAEPMAYVVMANNYEKLGRINDVVQTYLNAIEEGAFSSAIHHNLARTYEDVEEYDLAIEQYQILINQFGSFNHWKDLAWANIRANRLDSAERAYQTWSSKTGLIDLPTQKAIDKLKK